MKNRIYTFCILLVFSLTSLRAVELKELPEEGGERNFSRPTSIELEQRRNEPVTASDSSQLMQGGDATAAIAEQPRGSSSSSDNNLLARNDSSFSNRQGFSLRNGLRSALVAALTFSAPAHAQTIFPSNLTAIAEWSHCFVARRVEKYNERYCSSKELPKKEDCNADERNREDVLLKPKNYISVRIYLENLFFPFNQKLSCRAAMAHDCFYWSKKKELEDRIQDNFPLFKTTKDWLGRRANFALQEECKHGEGRITCDGRTLDEKAKIKSASHRELEALHREQIFKNPNAVSCLKAKWASEADSQLNQIHLDNMAVFAKTHNYFQRLIKPDEVKSRIEELASLDQKNSNEIKSHPAYQKLLEDEKNIKKHESIITGWQKAVEDYELFTSDQFQGDLQQQEQFKKRFNEVNNKRYYDPIEEFKKIDRELCEQIEQIKISAGDDKKEAESFVPLVPVNQNVSFSIGDSGNAKLQGTAW